MEFIIKIGILFVIGWIFGNDRKDRGLIGIRTITLVLLGSFMFTYIAGSVAGDSTRIIGQIVTGISFLCSGLIFKSDSKEIHNLTTAILVWCLAAVGCMVELWMLKEVLVLVIFILVVLHIKID